MRPLMDLVGRRFGRLLVLRRAANARGSNELKSMPRWACICDCGAEHTARAADLRAGKTRSCGCLRQETAAANGHTARARRAAKRAS